MPMSTYRPLLLSVILLGPAVACSAAEPRPLDAAAEAATRAAEQFVARHGYTVDGHPDDQPVVATSLYDVVYSPGQLVEKRKGLVSRPSVCTLGSPEGSHTVYFGDHATPGQFWFVTVEAGEARSVGHQPVPLPAGCAHSDRDDG